MDCMAADTNSKLDIGIVVFPDRFQAVVRIHCFHCMVDNVRPAVAVAAAVVAAVPVVELVESDPDMDIHSVLEAVLLVFRPLERLLFRMAPITSSCLDDKHTRWLATDAQPICHRLELCAFEHYHCHYHSPGPDNLPDSFVPSHIRCHCV